jgi:hypothetical protein
LAAAFLVAQYFDTRPFRPGSPDFILELAWFELEYPAIKSTKAQRKAQRQKK